MKTQKTLNLIINLSIASYILLSITTIMNWHNLGLLKPIATTTLAISVMIQIITNKNKLFFGNITFLACGIILLLTLNDYLNLFNVKLNSVNSLSILFIIVSQISKMTQSEYVEFKSIDDYEFGKEEEELDNSYNDKQSKLPQIFFGISVIMIVLGMIFRFLHYSGSSILNIFGFIIATLSILYITFKRKKNEKT